MSSPKCGFSGGSLPYWEPNGQMKAPFKLHQSTSTRSIQWQIEITISSALAGYDFLTQKRFEDFWRQRSGEARFYERFGLR